MRLGLLVVFFSSLCAMLAELMAGRLVAPFFGQSVRTWSVLMGVTLIGLTAGNLFGGWLSQRFRRHGWIVVVVALIVSGVCGLVLPSSLPVLFKVLSGLPETSHLAIFTFAGFLPLMTGLGCVSPSVATVCVRAWRGGKDLGVLYGVSMFGAMLGSALGGLCLPFILPADTVYLLFAVGLLALGGIIFLQRIQWTCIADVTGITSCDTVPKGIGEGCSGWVCAMTVFLLGWLGMAAELTGARLIIPSLGGSHIVWGVTFVTFIGGMGIGGMFGGWLADRFLLTRLLARLTLILSVMMLLTLSTQGFLFNSAWLLGLPMATRLVLQVVLLFMPLALGLGVASTVALRLAVGRVLGKGGSRARIGVCYALSGLGSAAGTFVTGQLLVGRINSPLLFGVCAMVFAVLSLLFIRIEAGGWCLRSSTGIPQRVMVFWTTSLVLYAAIRGEMPQDLFPVVRPTEITVRADAKILFCQESLYNMVTVVGYGGKDFSVREIYLDRIPHTMANIYSPETLSSSYTRLLAATVDTLRGVNKNLSMLMIGGGGYALPRYWREAGCWKEMTVVEIDATVQNAAITYMDATPTPWMRYMTRDGRAELDTLLATGRKGSYDFIIGDTISDAAVPYHLVTQEFNEKVNALLAQEGKYLVHVLDTYEEAGFLSSVLLTLEKTFPFVEALCYSGVVDVRQSYVVVASRTPVDMDAVMSTTKARHPEAKGFYLSDSQKTRLKTRSKAICFTDRFAPVERYVWRVISRDVQYKPFRMAQRAESLWAGGQREEALSLALEVLRLQPEQSVALRVLKDSIQLGLLAADEGLTLLKAQAERLSVMPDARIMYAEVLGQNGLMAEAVPVWADLFACWPDNENYALAWLDARIQIGEKDGVREWLESESSVHISFDRRKAFLERCK